MLNLNSLKNIKNVPMKVLASNKFVQSISNIDSEVFKENKSVIQNQEGKLDFKYKIVFEQGLHALKRFSQIDEPNHDLLKLAAQKFFEAIEIKKNKAEPYFYLSYIFSYFGQKEDALNYLKVATNINPDIEGKDVIVQQISKVESKSQTEPEQKTNINNVTKTTEPVQGEVKFKPAAMVVKRTANYSKF